MFRIEPVTEIPFEINPAMFEAACLAVSEQAPEAQIGVVNLAFVDDDTMRAYNRDYRKIDKTTDVLSFHYFEDFTDCDENEVSWEMLLSEAKIREQAPEYENSNESETMKLVIHSLFHLLGYDHEDDDEYAEMSALETAAARRFEEITEMKIA